MDGSHVMAAKKLGCTGALVALNVAIFVSLQLLPLSGQEWVEQWFALSREGILHGAVWQLITYQFLHATIFHLLANMVALWFVGRLMEWGLGFRRFLILYLVGGVVGGAIQLGFQGSESVVVGASAAVCSVLIGFCTLHANDRITALIFFVIPLRLRAKFLGWGIVLASLIFAIIGWPPGIGNLAHLGGSIFGFLSVRLWMRRNFMVPRYDGGVQSGAMLARKLLEQNAPNLTDEEIRRLEKLLRSPPRGDS